LEVTENVNNNLLKVKKELGLKVLYAAFTYKQNEQYYFLKPRIGLAQNVISDTNAACVFSEHSLCLRNIHCRFFGFLAALNPDKLLYVLF
jgi:hypothetical protein